MIKSIIKSLESTVSNRLFFGSRVWLFGNPDQKAKFDREKARFPKKILKHFQK